MIIDNNINIEYTWKELWDYMKHSFILLLKGIARIIWSVCLIIINLAIWTYRKAYGFTQKNPGLSVAILFALMSIMTVAVYASMKERLTTAQWQRDSLKVKVDSADAWKAGHGTRIVEYR
ncbi:MAG: hypothetical protein LKE41_00895 [Prevotella sp.]|jgi:hypothetical protein|nr:hypothetical protein [Prevotella sp.]